MEQLSLLVEHLRPARDPHDEVCSISARAVITATWLTVLGELSLLIAQIDERREALVCS